MTQLAVPEALRAQKADIVREWENGVVRHVAQLAGMERATLIDHLPEVIDGLAAWVEGRSDDADLAFAGLADGHAVQRLGVGIELAVVNVEYAWLRQIVMTRLLSGPCSSAVHAQIVSLNQGLDRAIQFSIRRYAQQRDYLRDRFIGILGHDLRNPLAAIAGAAEALGQSRDISDKDRKRATIIANATERMAQLIADVLDFAQGHLGSGIPVIPGECDMGQICRAVVEEMASAHPRRFINISTQGDLVGFFDRARVFQAIGNLLSNAIQYGKGQVDVAVWEEAPDRGAVLTRITNSGPPIPAASIPRLFEPFRSVGDKAQGGLGLGLFIVAQIARAHGAICEVSSSVQETVFTIRWPRTPLAEVPDRQ